MKKTLTLCAVGLLAMASLGLPTTSQAGDPIDDATVKHDVETALITHPVEQSHQIEVAVYHGVVQLSGFVDSENVHNTAERVAKQVAGVRSVDNNLMMRRNDATAEEKLTDSKLTTRVEGSLVANPVTKTQHINVATADNVVQLSGFVDSPNDKNLAAEIVRAVPGVRDIRNQLMIKSTL